jgi:hypothetical protein
MAKRPAPQPLAQGDHNEAGGRKAYPSPEDLIFIEQNADTYLTT